ncbi:MULTISPECIES: DUF4177 domain-containing protein [Aeromonas]|uniref:DUF4177 domain-containing protein n=2 Tax=Aeromonas TaxID=642 RepID=A0AAX3NW46_9GAMM|nr:MULTISPECIES: DUF4177 domain-containing protein [Aeromonas]EKP0305219.1 DUF4177 domain-containing protein [Aeromonas veronii]ELI6421055.1 DUF4177 domain-containing protein [Aeromonas veronii]MCF5727050.1 DUF4177 domain-containing protein [Aeromonas veronii]MDO2435704.1 DUF4177 domain-containing protein [Aeromonas veronii]TNI80895.1 hypothetical protein CF116_07675 [Aeromonas veronii]
MPFTYKVDTFIPTVSGCGAKDNGWDSKRCEQFQAFLNQYAESGWRLHSSDFREVTVAGCGGGKGAWLVCVFEKEL